ncbi:hypothetical protein psyc5s11_28130 [Clostridium gelidum]|uniref:Zinc-ribbon domain-containing protein n=1 Tax=Clostridium gelidum TaxID=704125 RepID=A0ABM7TC93_9CLOT|nr:hypothetical protein [Clostridium gelidum]BCZ46746.1 hypothetical protein psyc5s11_28130 [Clostridium gelidum]
MICPKCRKEFPKNSLFCNKCGTEILVEKIKKVNSNTAIINQQTHDVMTNENPNNKNSLNNTIGNIVIFISWIILICIIIGNVITWQKTNNLRYIISGALAVLGGLFNIYLLSKVKN